MKAVPCVVLWPDLSAGVLCGEPLSPTHTASGSSGPDKHLTPASSFVSVKLWLY